MPGDVNAAHLGVKHARRAMPVQVVHGLVNHPLVARDRPRRDDDPIAFQDVYERVPLQRKAGEG